MRYLIEQKITPLVNRYELFEYETGNRGEKLAFVEQKRFTFKEQITAWKGEDRSDVLFTLKAEKLLDVHGRFIVADGEGRQLGYFKKEFGQSLLRSTWGAYNNDDIQLFKVMERNLAGALLRRFGSWIPVAGDFLEFLPFNFDFLSGDNKVGHCSRVFALRDTYEIAVDESIKVDERQVLALGIALDALQAR